MLRAQKKFAVDSCRSRFVWAVAERRNRCSVSLRLYCVGLSDTGSEWSCCNTRLADYCVVVGTTVGGLSCHSKTQDWLIIVL
jgi:hypothetical protein